MKSSADIVIVGGGPAGMMAGMLFARAGIDTLVLEKHGDFLRDFRGDTVHPSTMEILSQLGLLEQFLRRPHNRLSGGDVNWEGRTLAVAEFSRLDTPAPFIAMMPQWEFLDFLLKQAEAYPQFALATNAEVVAVAQRGNRIDGVELADGRVVEARKLVLMADGRGSIVRSSALLPLEDLGAPIDVFWFKVPKQEQGDRLRAAICGGTMLVLIDRGEYWQCAFVIAKGNADSIRSRGIAAFRDRIRSAAPELPELERAVPDWDAVKLLSVSLDRLTSWHRPGLLAIGDAAHAMSPVGGVGINLAIQDAVCAANQLAGPMQRGEAIDPLLGQIERRRLFSTRVIQAAQRAAHRNLLEPALQSEGRGKSAPLLMRLLARVPLLQSLPGRFVGLGIRRERLTAPLARN